MNRINLICLGVNDLEKSLAFYKGLGFITTYNAERGIVFFDNSGTKLELYPIELLAKDINNENPPKINKDGFNGITLAINAKSKKEVDELMSIIENLGGKVIKAPREVFWGGYSGYFIDLDGYYWEVAYADFWKFDDNNMLIIK